LHLQLLQKDTMKSKKYHTVRTILKSNIKILERDTIDTPDTHIPDRSLSWLCTDTSIKRCMVSNVCCWWNDADTQVQSNL